MEQTYPRIAHHEMTKQEFKGDGEDKPDQTKPKGFLRRGKLQPFENEPNIDPKEHNEAYGG